MPPGSDYYDMGTPLGSKRIFFFAKKRHEIDGKVGHRKRWEELKH